MLAQFSGAQEPSDGSPEPPESQSIPVDTPPDGDEPPLPEADKLPVSQEELDAIIGEVEQGDVPLDDSELDAVLAADADADAGADGMDTVIGDAAPSSMDQSAVDALITGAEGEALAGDVPLGAELPRRSRRPARRSARRRQPPRPPRPCASRRRRRFREPGRRGHGRALRIL